MAALISVPYLGGILSVSLLGWPLVLKIGLAGLIGFAGARSVSRLALLSRPESVISIACKPGGDCLVVARGDRTPTLRILTRHRVFPHLVLLKLKAAGNGGSTRLVLDRQACGSDGFRQLKLQLLNLERQTDTANVY